MSGVRPGYVTSAVVDLLRTTTGKPIGAGKIPTPEGRGTQLDASGGYGIVDSVPPLRPVSETWDGNDHATVVMRLQLTGYGVQQDQAEWMRDEMVAIVCDRAGGQYVHTLTVPEMPDLSIGMRELVDHGPTDGTTTVQAPALVDLWVTVA